MAHRHPGLRLVPAPGSREAKADAAIASSGVLGRLAAFDPEVVGTVHVGLDTAAGDLDIVCCYRSSEAFARELRAFVGAFDGARCTVAPDHVVGGFEHAGFAFEIHASSVPTREQTAYRHFLAMRRLATLGGRTFREAVRGRKTEGLKTEPAIADYLALAGDPYAAVARLAALDDAWLRVLLDAAEARAAPP